MTLLKRFAPYAPIIGIIVVIGVAFFVWANGLTGDVAKLQSDVAHLTNGQDVIRQDIRDLHQEIRTSKSEVIAAISEHEHDSDGKVIFRITP